MEFNAGNKLSVSFPKWMLRGTREVIFTINGVEKTINHSFISFPDTSIFAGWQIDFTKSVFDSQYSDKLKYLYVYENAEYKIIKTPVDENGEFDYKNQDSTRIFGSDLKSEMESWKAKETSVSEPSEPGINEPEEDGPEL